MKVSARCLMLIAVCSLGGCVSAQPAGGAPQARAAASGTCRSDTVQWAIGQPATAEVTGRVWRESHAGLIRPLRPEQVIGKSTQTDRVTLELDRGNVIRRIYCG